MTSDTVHANAYYRVRRRQNSSKEGIQAVYLDIGSGTTESPVTADNPLPVAVAGLVPENYDYIELSYTGDNLTGVVYKDGGSSGTLIATIALTYDGAKLTSVART